MNIELHTQEGRDFFLGLGVSIVVHLAVVLVLLISWVMDTRADEEDDQDLFEEPSVEVILEEEEDEVALAMAEQPLLEEHLEPERERPMEEEEEEPIQEAPEEEEIVEEEEEAEEADEFEAPDPELYEHYAVDQETNEEEPLEADHISDQAHKVEEETVADVTTLEDVPTPEEELEAPLDESETELEMAMMSPEELQEPEFIDPNIVEELDEPPSEEIVEEDQEEQEESTAQEAREYLDPSELFADQGDRSPERPHDTERTLFEADRDRLRELFEQEERQGSQRQNPRGRRLLSSWKENEESLRASLENFLPHVQTGNHTSVNARAAAHASYIARMHRYIHANWALGFLPRVQNAYSNAHPLNDMSLSTIVEIVIDAQTGEVLETGPVMSSGNTIFDGEALLTAREIGRHPEPPSSIVSPDGKVYIHWTFWRDQRQCGSFGVRIYRLQGEGERRSISGDELDQLGRSGQP